jgi:hypothetical protein
MAAGPGIGIILSLGGLGIAAAVTIAAFFGIGLSLLIEHPAHIIRSRPLTPAVAQAPAAIAHPAAEARRVVPATHGGTASPLHATAESLALGATASANQVPTVVVQAQSEPTFKSGTTTAPAAAIPGSAPAPTTPDTAAYGSAARSSPSAPPPPQIETKPEPAHAAAAEPRPGAPVPAVNATGPAKEAAIGAAPSSAEISALLAQGDDAFRGGDVTSARLYYLRAFAVGEGRGALGIGATYDPLFLRRFHLWTDRAEPTEARAWYLRARNLGSSEAESRLAKLKAKPYR